MYVLQYMCVGTILFIFMLFCVIYMVYNLYIVSFVTI